MMAMPAFSLSAMFRNAWVFPAKTISPVYSPCPCTPLSTFIRVDFPAPFSPTRQWISRSSTWKLTLFNATTPGKVLVMFFISSMGVLISAPLSRKCEQTRQYYRNSGGVVHRCSRSDHFMCEMCGSETRELARRPVAGVDDRGLHVGLRHGDDGGRLGGNIDLAVVVRIGLGRRLPLEVGNCRGDGVVNKNPDVLQDRHGLLPIDDVLDGG